jgi:hypothetical protein
MPLNKGYPTNNTIVTPKVSHHNLHSSSCGLSLEGFMLIEIDSKLGFKRIDVTNLRSSIEFVLHGITGKGTKTLFGVRCTVVPLTIEITRYP